MSAIKLASLLAVTICLSLTAEAACLGPATKTVASTPVEHPFFYQVSRGGKTSYILGTFHIGVSYQDLPSPIRKQVESSTLIAVETIFPNEYVRDILDDTAATAKKMMPIESELSESQVETLTCYGLPTAIAKYVSDRNCEIVLWARFYFPRIKSIDTEVQSMAYATGKQLIALDNHIVTMEMLTTPAKKSTTPANPNACSVTRDVLAMSADDVLDMAQKEISTYLSGDEAAFVSAAADESVIARNKIWMTKLGPMLDQGNTTVVVGISHLVGPTGVIQALQDSGFAVTRVGL